MAHVLVLGGTQWLGREIAAAAVSGGHRVTCLARGEAGPVADGARLVSADRERPGAYDEVTDRGWDHVVDVSWQPGHVRSAVAALGPRAARWTYISSASVYATHDLPGADESAPMLEPLARDVATAEEYGEAKAACEQAVTDAMGDRALLARAGLIGGPGDRSDRFGYWVARLAFAVDAPVLVPDAPDQPTQTVDVRDLAAWIATTDAVGPVNVVGEQIPLGRVLDAAVEVAGRTGGLVAADPDWLLAHHVEPWMGPRSLPLWLPGDDHAGFAARADTGALAAGLHRRDLTDTLRDTLAYERSLGLDRERRAGLTRTEEAGLLAALAQDSASSE